MFELLEYVKKFGHLSFKEEPFNQVDAAIFSQLSIFNLDDIVGEGVTMDELFKRYLAKGHKVEDPVNFLMTNRQHYLFEALSIYPRYKNLIVSNYVRINEKEKVCQFEALTIDLGNEVLISYGGTDDSIVGWHEDFLLIYKEEIEAHVLGREYLNNIYNTFNKAILICGHSKGANISMEVALSIEDEIFDKIKGVYCFDGPGLCVKEYSKPFLDFRLKKIVSYIPYHSSIGRLFNHFEEFKVIKCSAEFARQHDLVFWEVIGNDFIYTEKQSDDSIYVENLISGIINPMTLDERKGLVEAIFKVFYKTDAIILEELVSRKLRIVFSYFGLKRRERKYIKKYIFKKLLKDKRFKQIIKNAMKVKKLY